MMFSKIKKLIRVVFRRVIGVMDWRVMPAGGRPADAPDHPLHGWLQGTVRIAPGADLTQPADPDWAETTAK